MRDSTTLVDIKYQRLLYPSLIYSPTRAIRLGKLTRNSPNIDAELYALIALIIRDFVNTWLTQITTDSDFTEEVLLTIGYVVREFEQRLENVDIISLILKDCPNVFIQHIRDYRTAKDSLDTAYAPNMTLEEKFHSLQPHFSMENDHLDIYLRCMAEDILMKCLPEKHLESECTRHLLREIVYNLVLKNVVNILSEPFQLHEIIIKILEPKQDVLDIKVEKRNNSGIFDKLRYDVVDIIKKLQSSIHALTALAMTSLSHTQHDLDATLIKLIIEILNLEKKSSWFIGQLNLFIIPLIRGTMGPLIDRLLARLIVKNVLSEDKLIEYLVLTRNILWPDGSFIKSKPPPSEEQQTESRKQVEDMVFNEIPKFIRSQVLGSSEIEQRQSITEIFDTISSKKCNQHLIMFLLDLVVSSLFPNI